ncbi:MAG: ATP-grasp domain-containing protein [Gammaproteobacteria bacterium]
MKILVFEFICGGGLGREELPGALAREGRLMLQSLLDSLSAIAEPDVVVMLDRRMKESVNLHGFAPAVISPPEDWQGTFERLAGKSDAVWPIAPECGGILQALCQTVEDLGKVLLTSPSAAVGLTGNKFLTYRRFIEHGIPTVPTRMLERSSLNAYPGENIVKAVDGIGCEDSYVIPSPEDWDDLPASCGEKGRYIVQPHVHGKKTSLSCLFSKGRAWLLCVNLQKFRLVDNRYRLSEIIVNAVSDLIPYQNLAAKLARAFPDLWGYAGIDLIVTADRILVLEINPRLTSSAGGIEDALGVNLASLVLQLRAGEPLIQSTRNRAITLKIKEERHEQA